MYYGPMSYYSLAQVYPRRRLREYLGRSKLRKIFFGAGVPYRLVALTGRDDTRIAMTGRNDAQKSMTGRQDTLPPATGRDDTPKPATGRDDTKRNLTGD